MPEKICITCNTLKPLSEYYKHAAMKDGHLGKCKECQKANTKKNYNPDRERIRNVKPHRVAARAAYQKTEAGKAAMRRGRDKWREKNTIKRAAHIIVGNAVRDGKITKPDSCEECGCTPKRLHGHHDDYTQPLNVRWLCPKCHTAWHKAYDALKEYGNDR
tara:strand:+ start:137 stop:616 length:480 start_codon:yes stop_codon:yes gene_type:complete